MEELWPGEGRLLYSVGKYGEKTVHTGEILLDGEIWILLGATLYLCSRWPECAHNVALSAGHT